jgi:6-phosphogluconate dehydrogenase
MADGAGGVGKAVQDALTDIGKDLTVNLAKDMLEQIAGGKSSNTTQNTGSNNQQLGNIQRNIKIANLSRRIQLFKQRRTQAQQQNQKDEQIRQRQQEEDRKKFLEKQQKKGLGGKLTDMFANFGAVLARRGKGEQRGNKSSG